MYAYFKGTIADKEEDCVIIDVNNIGYRIFCPVSLINSLSIGQAATLYTYTSVREDAFVLFGFDSKDDLRLFKLLITVSGVGPKMAAGILSSLDGYTIKSAIISQNAKLLSSANGVGAKTAGRIILELKDKISCDDLISSLPQQANGEESEKVIMLRNEAFEALTGLGVSASDATNAINKIEITQDLKIESIIRQLLSII